MRAMLATCAAAALAPAAPLFAGQDVGSPPPEMEGGEWFNTPPLTFEKLRGKAVLVEVFRTW